MEKFVVTGGKPLTGEVAISGAKNAAVGILPATILAGGVCVIENLPNISDVSVSLNILSALIPPIAGVMIASYWIVGKGRRENLVEKEGWYLPGILAFAIGALVAYITGNIVVLFIGPVNGIVTAMLAFIILERVMAKGGKA